MRLSDEYHENLPSENAQLSLENTGMFVGNKGFWQYKGMGFFMVWLPKIYQRIPKCCDNPWVDNALATNPQ